jgi:hypothetical protein
MFITKKTDSKGRITLGKEYANTILIIIKENNDDLLIQRAEVVPTHEAWLYKNKKALSDVRIGIEQAKKHMFAKKHIDMKADESWLNEIEE